MAVMSVFSGNLVREHLVCLPMFPLRRITVYDITANKAVPLNRLFGVSKCFWVDSCAVKVRGDFGCRYPYLASAAQSTPAFPSRLVHQDGFSVNVDRARSVVRDLKLRGSLDKLHPV